MADFCYGCVLASGGEEYAPSNDFAALVLPGQMITDLCEGCGVHAFDHEGKRQCSSPSMYDDPTGETVRLFDCPECKPDPSIWGLYMGVL